MEHIDKHLSLGSQEFTAPTKSAPAGAILSARNITKTFHGKTILKEICLNVYNHEVIALIGSSGAGKSTFLRCLNLLEHPNKGSLFLHGVEIPLIKTLNGTLHAKSRSDLLNLRTKVGFVFQSFNLWSHLTVLENIIEAPISVLGLHKDEAVSVAENLLEQLGLSAKINARPSSLSGGQQQRVALARALAMNPDVLLLDEPTSALDPESTLEVKTIINNLAKHKTVVLVTHDLQFCRAVATRALYFNGGIIEEEGLTQQLFDSPKSSKLAAFLDSSKI